MDNSVGGMIQKLFDTSDSVIKDFEEKREIGERFLLIDASSCLGSIITEAFSEDGNNAKCGALSDKLRAEGNTLFQAGQFRQAAEKFTEAAKKVE